MDKEKKDKIIGIFGILLFIVAILSTKLSTYYNIVVFTNTIDAFILFLLMLIALSLSILYFNQLFKGK